MNKETGCIRIVVWNDLEKTNYINEIESEYYLIYVFYDFISKHLMIIGSLKFSNVLRSNDYNEYILVIFSNLFLTCLI